MFELTEQKLRDAATLLAAIDHVLWDDMELEKSIWFAKRWIASVDNDPLWADGRHEGDCTKQPHTCSRCVLEDYEDRIRAMWKDEGGG